MTYPGYDLVVVCQMSLAILATVDTFGIKVDVV